MWLSRRVQRQGLCPVGYGCIVPKPGPGQCCSCQGGSLPGWVLSIAGRLLIVEAWRASRAIAGVLP